MNKGGHLAVGFIVGILFLFIMSKTLGWFEIMDYRAWIGYLAICLIYSLLADIDHKMSTITWFFIGAGVVGVIAAYTMNNKILMLISVLLLGLTYIAAQFFPHRGPTHTIWFAALTTVPIYLLLGWQEMILAFIVYYSHLVADGEFFKLAW